MIGIKSSRSLARFEKFDVFKQVLNTQTPHTHTQDKQGHARMLRALDHAEGHVESLGSMDMGHDNMMVSRREGGADDGGEGGEGRRPYGKPCSAQDKNLRTETASRPHLGRAARAGAL